MSASTAGRVLAALAVVGAVAVASLGYLSGSVDGILAALAGLGVLAGVAVLVADARRGRPAVGETPRHGTGDRPRR